MTSPRLNTRYILLFLAIGLLVAMLSGHQGFGSSHGDIFEALNAPIDSWALEQKPGEVYQAYDRSIKYFEPLRLGSFHGLFPVALSVAFILTVVKVFLAKREIVPALVAATVYITFSGSFLAQTTGVFCL